MPRCQSSFQAIPVAHCSRTDIPSLRGGIGTTKVVASVGYIAHILPSGSGQWGIGLCQRDLLTPENQNIADPTTHRKLCHSQS
jgi:hypothetical protein